MAFRPFHISQSQPLYNENPFEPHTTQMKCLNPVFSQGSARTFGTDITNRGHIPSERVVTQYIKFQEMGQSDELSKVVREEVNETEEERSPDDTENLTSTSIACSQHEDHISNSNYMFNSQMEVEANLRLSSTDLLSQQEEDEVEDEIMELCDIHEKDNPQYVSEYATEIFKHLRENERNIPTSDPLINQREINEKIRALLLDWIINVHERFKFQDETLFLTVNLIDRYFEKHYVSRERVQLIGITAMFIACKYEEIYAAELKDFLFVAENIYTREEVLRAEGIFLSTIGFNLTFTSALAFFERYCQVHEAEKKTEMLGIYLLVLSLLEYKMLRYKPSNIAASALYLASKVLKKVPWDDHLKNVTKYTEPEIRSCAKDLLIILRNASKSKLQSVPKKFAQEKYLTISTSKFPWGK